MSDLDVPTLRALYRNLQHVVSDKEGPEEVFAARVALDAAMFDALPALLDEMEGRVAVCLPCRSEVTACDEDRCCTTCGADLVVCADRHSVEMVFEYVENDAEDQEAADAVALTVNAHLRELLDAAERRDAVLVGLLREVYAVLPKQAFPILRRRIHAALEG